MKIQRRNQSIIKTGVIVWLAVLILDITAMLYLCPGALADNNAGAAESSPHIALTAGKNEQIADILNKARLLANRGEGPAAMTVLQDAYTETGSETLAYAILRLQNSQWKVAARTVYYNSDRSSGTKEVYTYDALGHKILTEGYSLIDGELKNPTVQTFFYNENGFYESARTEDAEGNLTSESIYTCDVLGNPIYMDSYRDGGITGTFIYEWNDFGDFTKIIRWNTGGSVSQSQYVMDDYGLNSEVINNSGSGSVTIHFRNEYTFSDDGKSCQVISYRDNSDFVSAVYDLIFIPFQ